MGMRQPGNIMTLNRFMIEATRSDPDHGDFESLMTSIQLACKTVANALSSQGVVDLGGVRTSTISTGELLQPYDYANYVFKNSLRFTGKIGMLAASEDDEKPAIVEEAWNSKYIAVVDPLDGSENIDVGIATGSIFGVYKEKQECLTEFGEVLSKEANECLLQTLVRSNRGTNRL